MKRGYEIEQGKIVINRELTELDIFVRDFINVLKKHSNYLIVSGFVSIATGRPRGTEDVDILVPLLDEKKFQELFNELVKNKFWCYQSDNCKEVYRYIKSLDSVRFAREGEIFPNMELIPITQERKSKYFEFSNPQEIRVSDFEFKIPWIEFEITYKEKVLGSKKDLEDAQHLRTFFSEILDEDKFRKSCEVIENEI